MTENVDLHAGLTETSLMLHLRPEAVDMTRAEAGNTSALAEILDDLSSGGVAAVSANGVLGDPTGATAVDGQGILNRIVDDVLQRIRAGSTDSRGMLTNTPPEVSA